MEVNLGKIEMALGLGLMIGPFISGLIYPFLHFAGTFMFFAGVLLVAFVVLYVLLP